MRNAVTLFLFFIIFSNAKLGARPSILSDQSNNYFYSTTDSIKSEYLVYKKYTVNLEQNLFKPKSAAGTFFKPVGVSLLTGIGLGGAIGFAFPSGSLDRPRSAVVWGVFLGAVGLAGGITIGFSELIKFNKQKKNKPKYKILND